MPGLRGLEQPRRDGRPRAGALRARRSRGARLRRDARPSGLAGIGEADLPRLSLGIGELDRVLGGGLVPGSLVLLGGEPGIGKSTLLLQAAAGLPGAPAGALASSTRPARSRPARSGCGRRASACCPGPPARACGSSPSTRSGGSSRWPGPSGPGSSSSTRSRPRRSTTSTARPGSVGQVRESTLRLMELAKGEGIAVILVGHVTKDGSIAGPKTLEHLVDAVLNLEGERYAALRLLRATKNRFGSTEEVGVFEMAETGPRSRSPIRPGRSSATTAARARAASSRRRSRAAGRCSSRSRRSSARPGYGTPSRRASGLDPNRLSLLIAVLGRRAGIGLGSHDVYANLAGGLSVDGARPRPAARPRPRVVAARSARSRRDRRDRRGRAARRAARRGRASSGVCARRPGSGSRGRSSRGRRADAVAHARIEGLTVVDVANAPRRDRGRAGRPARPPWRGGPGDARLTVRPGRSRPGTPAQLAEGTVDPLHPPPGCRARRPRRARRSRRRGDGAVRRQRLRRRPARGLGRRLGRRRASRSCRTSRSCPATWLIRRVEELSTAEFVTAVIGLLIGLLMGLLLGLPLSAISPTVGTVAAARRLDLPRSRAWSA